VLVYEDAEVEPICQKLRLAFSHTSG